MTFLSDILFGQSKKIHGRDFNKALGKISNLSSSERKYLNQVFKNDLAGGLSEYELKQRISKLRHNSDDPLDSWEVEQVRRKLLGELKK